MGVVEGARDGARTVAVSIIVVGDGGVIWWVTTRRGNPLLVGSCASSPVDVRLLWGLVAGERWSKTSIRA